MIVSFGDLATKALYDGSPRKDFKAILPSIHGAALRKLDMLNAATNLGDLRSPPGNRLDALKDDLTGWHSIRINDQWRIIFRWHGSDVLDVRVVDYH